MEPTSHLAEKYPRHSRPWQTEETRNKIFHQSARNRAIWYPESDLFAFKIRRIFEEYNENCAMLYFF